MTRTSGSTLRPLAAALCVAAVAAIAAGCGGGDEEASKPASLSVVTTLAPIDEAVRRIGGDAVAVTNITPVGGQPHGLQPSEAAVKALRGARLVVTIGPAFQPAVSAAVNELPADVARVDLLGSSGLLRPAKPIRGTRGPVDGAVDADADPHLWVSPKRFAGIVEGLRDALVKADPGRRTTYERGATSYLQELGVLDDRYRAAFGSCQTTTLLTTHPAFGYLAEDYGLTQAVAAGIPTASRPDPRSLAATGRYAASKDATTLFFAAPVPSRIAKTVKASTDLSTATLNPIEGLTQDQIDAGDTYLTLMRTNLETLTEGLGCEPVALGAAAPAASTPDGSTRGGVPGSTPGA